MAIEHLRHLHRRKAVRLCVYRPSSVIVFENVPRRRPADPFGAVLRATLALRFLSLNLTLSKVSESIAFMNHHAIVPSFSERAGTPQHITPGTVNALRRGNSECLPVESPSATAERTPGFVNALHRCPRMPAGRVPVYNSGAYSWHR
jgi:hypothetical protein